MTISARLEHIVCSPVGSSERRTGWTLAAVSPLVIGLGVAALLPSIGVNGVLTAVNATLLILLLAVSSYTDSRWHKIPNWATYSAVVWALGLNLIASLTMEAGQMVATASLVPAIGIRASLLGAAVCFAVMLLVFQLAGSGAGDVKLATALGAILGVGPGLTVILWCHIAAGLAMAGLLVWQIGPLRLVLLLLRYAGSVVMPNRIAKPGIEARRVLQRPVPLAAFFAVGTILAYCQGPIL